MRISKNYQKTSKNLKKISKKIDRKKGGAMKNISDILTETEYNLIVNQLDLEKQNISYRNTFIKKLKKMRSAIQIYIYSLFNHGIFILNCHGASNLKHFTLGYIPLLTTETFGARIANKTEQQFAEINNKIIYPEINESEDGLKLRIHFPFTEVNDSKLVFGMHKFILTEGLFSINRYIEGIKNIQKQFPLKRYMKKIHTIEILGLENFTNSIESINEKFKNLTVKANKKYTEAKKIYNTFNEKRNENKNEKLLKTYENDKNFKFRIADQLNFGTSIVTSINSLYKLLITGLSGCFSITGYTLTDSNLGVLDTNQIELQSNSKTSGVFIKRINPPLKKILIGDRLVKIDDTIVDGLDIDEIKAIYANKKLSNSTRLYFIHNTTWFPNVSHKSDDSENIEYSNIENFKQNFIKSLKFYKENLINLKIEIEKTDTDAISQEDFDKILSIISELYDEDNLSDDSAVSNINNISHSSILNNYLGNKIYKYNPKQIEVEEKYNTIMADLGNILKVNNVKKIITLETVYKYLENKFQGVLIISTCRNVDLNIQHLKGSLTLARQRSSLANNFFANLTIDEKKFFEEYRKLLFQIALRRSEEFFQLLNGKQLELPI